MSSEGVVITRRAAAPAVEAFTAPTEADFMHAVAVLAQGRRWIGADLSLGAWRGHQLARELAEQLGLDELEQRLPAIGASDAGRDYADVVARLIDQESAGEHARSVAYLHACRTVAAVEREQVGLIVVVAPRAGFAWENEDVWFLRFLSAGLASLSSRLVLAADADAVVAPFPTRPLALPPGSSGLPRVKVPARAAAIPGMFDCRWSAALEITGESLSALALPGNRALLPPSSRSRRLEWPALPASFPVWLHAAGQCARPASARDPASLQAAAAQRFAEGGYGIALRLVEKAQEAAQDPLQWAALESQAQSMRIAALDFAAAGERPAPGANLPREYRRNLALGKAWGLALTGQAAAAEPLFALARELSGDLTRDRLGLYILNISALNKLRLGQVGEAFAFEGQIERALETGAHDWHISYINSINLARLHRGAKDLAASRRCFERAFATATGLRSESDHVYFNLCQGRLEMAAGRPAAALPALLRAALHWLSLEVPEALAPRVVRSMTPKGELPAADVVEPVSQRLEAELLEAFRETTGGAELPRPPSHIVFRRAREVARIADAVVFGAPGWGVIGSERESPPCFVGAAYEGLRDTVVGLLRLQQPQMAEGVVGTIFTDDRCGVELPATPSELLDVAVRWRASAVCFGAERMALSPDIAQAIEERAGLALADGLDDVARAPDGLVVRFKRYRSPQVLRGVWAELVLFAHEEATVAEISARIDRPVAAVVEALRVLEREHIVVISSDGAARATA